MLGETIMKTEYLITSLHIAMLLIVTGCTSVQNFGLTARPGETIAITLGYQPELTRENTQITITDAGNNQTTYTASSPQYRALINIYPDPVSKMIVNKETGLGATNAADLVEGIITYGDKEYTEKLLILDLPDSMVPGTATISITDGLDQPIINPYGNAGKEISDMYVEVLAGSGSGIQDAFQNQEVLNILPAYLRAQERAPHYKVTFQGSEIPHAIQVEMTHDADLDNGDTGRAYVVNPRGDIKNILWADDGYNLKVILVPTHAQNMSNMSDFKFYIAGGLTGLSINQYHAYDINGEPVQGVTPKVE